MKTQGADLRRKTREILEALDRDEEVTITQRGSRRERIAPPGSTRRRPVSESAQAGPGATKDKAAARDAKTRKRNLTRRRFDDT